MPSAAVQAKPSPPPASPKSGSFVAPEKRNFVFSLLLLLLTITLYNSANHFSFINYDDNHYITENSHVRAGLTLDTLRWAFTSFDQANWHPLTWISHALDCQLFRLNPAGHHLSSIVLHALNVILLFLLLTRSTRRPGPSLFVAALFALHPLNVESVAWIAERKNVLSTFFFLLTLGAYGWYALKPNWKRYLAVVGLLACGLASKPMLVTAPFVLLLLDLWPLRRIRGWTGPDTSAFEQSTFGKLLLEKLPLLLLAAASSVMTLRAQQASGAVGTLPFPLPARLANAIVSYALYLWKAIWPSHLTLFYPYSGNSLPLWKVAAAAGLLIAITAVVIKMRSRGYLVVGWLWFLGTLVPVIGLIQVGNQAMADRYAYIPLIGIFVMLAWGVSDWANERKWPLALRVIPAVVFLLGMAVVTNRQLGYWRDSLDLWAHAMTVTEHNYVAEENEGVALVQLGRVDEAYPFFVRAAQDQPNDPVARVNIGSYLYQHGHRSEAIEQYEVAVHLSAEPGVLSAAYANLGTAYSELGDARSPASFEQALRLNPDNAAAWQGMAVLLQKQNKVEESINYLAHAVQLQPSGQGYLQLARALAQTNHRAEAVAAYQQALRLEPGLAQIQSQGR